MFFIKILAEPGQGINWDEKMKLFMDFLLQETVFYKRNWQSLRSIGVRYLERGDKMGFAILKSKSKAGELKMMENLILFL